MKNFEFSKRRNLFEFGDQPWLRGWFREAYVDCLNFLLKQGGHYSQAYEPFLQWIEQADGEVVLDLASGGGGPVDTLHETAIKAGKEMPKIILSDLFPNQSNYLRLQQKYGSKAVGFVGESLSATDVPAKKDYQLRLMSSALHHFSPDMARKIISDAVIHGQGIFILEPFKRDLRHLMMAIFTGPFLGMLTPFVDKRFSIKKCFVCTIFPIIPLMVQFDGIMSVLRTYTFSELMEMFPSDIRDELSVRTGENPYLWGCSSTYFYVCRKSVRKSDENMDVAQMSPGGRRP
jgi:hypothetical protein